jgi:hypothetical protein
MAHKIDLIRQALSAAESSIKLARQLLNEVETEGSRTKQKAKELPGISGIFDGQNMTNEKGETVPVPENYASKSLLVVGDTLKLVEHGKEKRFKQVEHVKRHKTTGILAKKDGKWTAVTSEGSYKLLPASVEHFDGEAGDEVLVQLPANNLQTTWAAVEKISKKGQAKPEEKTLTTKTMDKQKEDQVNKDEKTKKEEKKPKKEEQKEKKPELPKEKIVANPQPQPKPVEKPKEVQSKQAAEDELS